MAAKLIGMNKFQSFLPAIFIYLLIGCKNHSDNPFVKVWFYNANQTDQQQKENEVKYRAHENYALEGSNFINLQPDSTYTSFLMDYDYGRWYYKDSLLILVNHNRQPLELVVNKVDDELICTDKMQNIIYRFYGYPNKFLSAAQNPFSQENNQWRLKASHKESDAEIASRLSNHFRYWEKYFAWGEQTNINSLDYTTTPGPLKMYGNGFALEYLDKQLPQWKESFYDTTDCRKAYEKLYYLMVEKDIQWPKTTDRCKRFVSAFQQLQDWMR